MGRSINQPALIKKKKILVCIDWFLPGFRAGGPVSSCAGLVEHLSADFDFYIVCRDTDYTMHEPYAGIEANRWMNKGDGVSVIYISKDHLRFSTFRKLLNEVRPHRVYLNSMFSFWFTLVPLWLCKKGALQVLLATRGMLAPGALSVKAWKKRLFLRLAKSFGLFDTVVFQASSPIEELQIRSVFPNASVKIAPNLPRKTIEQDSAAKSSPASGLRLINIARIAPEKNLLGALQILHSVTCPVTFDFYGPVYNEAYWSECRQVIASLPEHVNVNYKGVIEPTTISEILAQYHFLFMPTLGENFGHIIYESLQAGTPVIISNQTPWKQLVTKQAGWDLELNQASQFVDIIELCAKMDAETYKRLQNGSKATAAEFMAESDALELNRALLKG